MKKLITLVLAAMMLLSLAACGTINDNEVAILWNDEGVAKNPNSLINAMERAMYIENISYKHYGAKGDQTKQVAQAQEALDAGCSVLMVNLVDASAAQQITDMAKEKKVPVVFFGCEVEQTVLDSYDKCLAVSTDAASLAKVQGNMISKYAGDNAKDLDRNDDGKISYACVGEISVKLSAKGVKFEEVSLDLTSLNPKKVELIITADDALALDTLVALQAQDYNTNKLTTHYVPLFTVGNNVDYKAYVLADAPKGEAERKAHYEANRYLVDLTTVEEADLEEMIYTTTNVIDGGRITGTALEDYDAVAAAAAAIARNLIQGKDALKDVEHAKGSSVTIPYTTYGG